MFEWGNNTKTSISYCFIFHFNLVLRPINLKSLTFKHGRHFSHAMQIHQRKLSWFHPMPKMFRHWQSFIFQVSNNFIILFSSYQVRAAAFNKFSYVGLHDFAVFGHFEVWPVTQTKWIWNNGDVTFDIGPRSMTQNVIFANI